MCSSVSSQTTFKINCVAHWMLTSKCVCLYRVLAFDNRYCTDICLYKMNSIFYYKIIKYIINLKKKQKNKITCLWYHQHIPRFSKMGTEGRMVNIYSHNDFLTFFFLFFLCIKFQPPSFPVSFWSQKTMKVSNTSETNNPQSEFTTN